MRIIGGYFKGRVLQSPDGRGTRPTDARSREMLFNVLGERALEARVLDLYGGTGALGIEALSRGASSCVFIEQNAAACRSIKANLEMLQVSGAAQVWQSTVKSALRKLSADGAGFDLVLADPPFSNLRELGELCKSLDTAAALLDNKARRRQASSSTPEPSLELASDASQMASAAARELGEESEDEEPALGPMLVIQHHHRQSPTLGERFVLWREKRAGESTFSFFVPSEAAGRSEERPESAS